MIALNWPASMRLFKQPANPSMRPGIGMTIVSLRVIDDQMASTRFWLQGSRSVAAKNPWARVLTDIN